jgi:hypothetical protein
MDFKRILREEIDDLDWIRSITFDPTSVGNLIFVGNDKSNSNASLKENFGRNEFTIIKFVDINENNQLAYEIVYTTKQLSFRNSYVDLEWAYSLFNESYWRVLNHPLDLSLFRTIKDVNYFTPYLVSFKGKFPEYVKSVQ